LPSAAYQGCLERKNTICGKELPLASEARIRAKEAVLKKAIVGVEAECGAAADAAENLSRLLG
jgi:hypothetical protein